MPNPGNLLKRKSFVKNDPRINKKGRPPILPDLQVLLAEVLGKKTKNKVAALAILDALQKKAAKGDVRAAEVLLNRSYGLPKQFIDLNNTGETIIKIIRTAK